MCGVARKLGRREQLRVVRRLGGEDVEGGAGEAAVREHRLEGRLVDEAAARRVDEHGARAAAAPGARRESMPRVLSSSGTCRVTMSARRSSSSSPTGSTWCAA